jgi:hypothetical protein
LTGNQGGAPTITDAWKFTPGSGWTLVTSNLPIPTDTSVEPPQPSGAQAWTVSHPTYDPSHIVFAGGAPANAANPPALPPNVSGKTTGYTVFTNNAIDYDVAAGAFFDTSMVPDTVIADPTVTPNVTFLSGTDTQCVTLSDGRRVCCGGRHVRGTHSGFSLGNRCQIYAPSARAWTACQDFPGVSGEDFDNPVCCPAPGCAPIPQCMDPNNGRSEAALAVTSNDHVLIVGGWYRQEYLAGGPSAGYDNAHLFPSRAVIDFNPGNCTSGTAYTVLGAMLYARAQPQIAPIVSGGDSFLVIGGSGGTDLLSPGDLYQTERLTYTKSPAAMTTQRDADLPSWVDTSNVAHPFAASLNAFAGLLTNGQIFYAGAWSTQTKNNSNVGSANMMTLWRPTTP